MTTLLLHMFLYCKFYTIISNASVIIHRHTCLPTFLMMLVIVMLLTNTYSTYYVPGTVLSTLYTLSPNPHNSFEVGTSSISMIQLRKIEPQVIRNSKGSSEEAPLPLPYRTSAYNEK